MSYIGADLGTSSLKLLLMDEDGSILASVSKSYPVYYPNPGWSEQDPEDWITAFKSGIKELLKGQDSKAVRGIGFGGQMHGLVILDADDKVIRRAILWNDGRTEKETEYLNEEIGRDKLSRYTANIAFAGFTAPKILWLRNNEPESYKRIKKIMLPKDYLVYRLTGIHATDYSDASGMLLLDVEHRCWSKEMCDICGISEDMLPGLYESYEKVGTLLPRYESEFGVKDVTVAAGAGDNAAAAVGTGTVGEGACNISLGTSGTIFISGSSFRVDSFNALHSFDHADGGYHLMGCMLSAASCAGWWMDKVIESKDFDAECEGMEQRLGRNDVYFLPYLMGERSPLNDVNARGVFLGLTPESDRKDMLQAIFEGVSFGLRDCLEVARKLGLDVKSSMVCGGGAKNRLWLKILANVLNIRLTIPACEEGPSMGGAMLAMVACGRFGSVKEACESIVSVKGIIDPDMGLANMYDHKYKKWKKIYPALKLLFNDHN